MVRIWEEGVKPDDTRVKGYFNKKFPSVHVAELWLQKKGYVHDDSDMPNHWKHKDVMSWCSILIGDEPSYIVFEEEVRARYNNEPTWPFVTDTYLEELVEEYDIDSASWYEWEDADYGKGVRIRPGKYYRR